MIRIDAFNMDDCLTAVSDCGGGVMIGITGHFIMGLSLSMLHLPRNAR